MARKINMVMLHLLCNAGHLCIRRRHMLATNAEQIYETVLKMLITASKNPLLLWNSTFHYHVHTIPPLDPNQINLVHVLSPSFLKIQINIFSHLRLGLTSGLFSFMFPRYKFCIHYSSLSCLI